MDQNWVAILLFVLFLVALVYGVVRYGGGGTHGAP